MNWRGESILDMWIRSYYDIFVIHGVLIHLVYFTEIFIEVWYWDTWRCRTDLQKVWYGLNTLLIEFIQSERNNPAESSLA